MWNQLLFFVLNYYYSNSYIKLWNETGQTYICQWTFYPCVWIGPYEKIILHGLLNWLEHILAHAKGKQYWIKDTNNFKLESFIDHDRSMIHSRAYFANETEDMKLSQKDASKILVKSNHDAHDIDKHFKYLRTMCEWQS